MSNISQDKLLDTVESRYALVVLAAKRARQLREHAAKLIETDSTNPLTIALEEITSGRISYDVADHDEPTTMLEEPELLGLPSVPETEDILPIPDEEAGEEVEMASSEASAVEETLLEVPEVVTEEPAQEAAEAQADETPAAEAEVSADVDTPESTAAEQSSQPED